MARPPSRRSLSPEEKKLWKRVTNTITPLSTPATPEQETPQKEKPEFFTPDIAPPPLPPHTKPATAKAHSVDKRTAERLRGGKMEIEARLDLHGHTREEAYTRLHQFMAMAHLAGKRCVLIITGKGGKKEGDGILKREVPRWLAEEPLAPLILLASPAKPQHGGTGALYVLLKRKR